MPRKSRYHQGRFAPTNPERYVGDVNKIVFRSSWERKTMRFLDRAPHIIKWASEEHIIPYVSPLDGKVHRYFMDFWIQYRGKSGAIREALVEVKPKAQTQKPKRPGRKTEKAQRNYEARLRTYLVNEAKWVAAKQFCDKQGMQFIIATENTLRI